ncbi:MAG: hypothetical protein K2M96_03905 [Prevotella sp.]|nr:hypothetical protein [Prevotella sp.]
MPRHGVGRMGAMSGHGADRLRTSCRVPLYVVPIGSARGKERLRMG